MEATLPKVPIIKPPALETKVGGANDSDGIIDKWNSFLRKEKGGISELDDKLYQNNLDFARFQDEFEASKQKAYLKTQGITSATIEGQRKVFENQIKNLDYEKRMVELVQDTEAEIASQKAVFAIKNKDTELSTNRYKITPLSKYGLNTSFHGITQQSTEKAATESIKLKRTSDILAAQEKLTELEFKSRMGEIDSETMLKSKLETQTELLVNQQAQFDAIKDLADGDKQRNEELAKVLATSKAIMETQKAIYDRTAIGGFTNSLKEYVDTAMNMGESVKGLTTTLFKGMEDALTNFATKGKLDFKSLADSIIADMMRIAVKQAITGPLAMLAQTAGNALGGMLGGSISGYNPSTVYAGSSPGPWMPSAAGGYDIPAGVNPLVQTHAEEMILPKGYADVIRGLANKGGTGSDASLTVNLVNQSGNPVKAKEGNSSFDGKSMVKTIILEAMDTDPGFRWAMRGGQ
jgi:lambda family phage tail tape measure protein